MLLGFENAESARKAIDYLRATEGVIAEEVEQSV